MAIHSQYSCLGNPMDRGTQGASPWGGRESDMTEHMHVRKRLTQVLVLRGGGESLSLLPYPFSPTFTVSLSPEKVSGGPKPTLSPLLPCMALSDTQAPGNETVSRPFNGIAWSPGALHFQGTYGCTPAHGHPSPL